ncbi:MAG: hypothetical protein FJ184_10065 [Gammaproteobacteria bacterium]|nr:hypothetical protein [Gammaproteobacteria bacterium]
MSQELFRAKLDALIDLSHPLAKLTRAMPWAEIDVAVSATLRPAPVGAGRPALRIRFCASILQLFTRVFGLSNREIGPRAS